LTPLPHRDSENLFDFLHKPQDAHLQTICLQTISIQTIVYKRCGGRIGIRGTF
jgi:hypothetical protein